MLIMIEEFDKRLTCLGNDVYIFKKPIKYE